MSDTHAHTVAYVRDTMMPQQPAPAGQGGAVRWLRENLFATPLNVALTLIGLLIVWFLVTHFYPWFAHSVWRAGSLAECRQIITDRWGEGATGACWAVIRARWHQFAFGFYPPELYWRPLLVWGLLLIAIAPVLFYDKARLRQGLVIAGALMSLAAMAALGTPMTIVIACAVVMAALGLLALLRPDWALVFTLLFPALAIWLQWGGSAWTVLSVLAGFVAGWLAFRLVVGTGSLLAIIVGIAATLIWWFYAAGPVAAALRNALPLDLTYVESRQFGGFLLAITLGVGGIVMSLPLGIVLALARRSDMFLVKSLAVMFIEFIRGVPLITLLFVASLLLNYFLPPGTNFDIILRVMILVTLFASAYIAEVIRGGLAALPRGQYEAADALGLDYLKAQRLIVLPQALKISIPGIVGTFIGMFKDTTLVVFVGLFDPLKAMSDTVRADFAWKGIYWEPFIFVGAIFFLICFGMSRYAMYLERQLKRDHR
ncbi:amino acid ABC transporter permease [Paracoccus sp. p4-l81]|uniref:amino acid ABC transporter permease n=1 Tax=Paracoccus sp. p4-l81 TaxID=3342806 RepID=UPI0035B8E4BE